MKWLIGALSLVFLSTAAAAATLPGFRAERLAQAPGFITSIAVDSKDTVYYSLKGGEVYRLDDDGESTLVATVTTDQEEGNHGLIGMALLDDVTAAVHYTEPGPSYEVISRIDLVTGEETVLARLSCDADVPGRPVSSEHHGGNPAVAADGSIFVGIGDFGGGVIASKPEWTGGKIFRIHPDGRVEQYARGVRNPFDLIWEDDKQRLVVADNGPEGGDELNILTGPGANLGWPFTFGGNPPIEGTHTPDYLFPTTVAPTGMLRLLPDAHPLIGGGYLVAAFVSGAIYYFPDLETRPIAEPIALINNELGPIIDVAQGARGTIYFSTYNRIYVLHAPRRGDCNGDGLIDAGDYHALKLELADHAPKKRMLDAQDGTFPGSWGCDVNADGLIDGGDVTALLKMVTLRRRSAGR
ncbi:MAG TPA: PQQ-dependent sugar dehydrogenase [Thermoanaerobaculia bacterium]